MATLCPPPPSTATSRRPTARTTAASSVASNCPMFPRRPIQRLSLCHASLSPQPPPPGGDDDDDDHPSPVEEREREMCFGYRRERSLVFVDDTGIIFRILSSGGVMPRSDCTREASQDIIHPVIFPGSTSLAEFQDRVQVFLAVFFWMSLFFWNSAWEGKNGGGGRPNKGGPFKR